MRFFVVIVIAAITLFLVSEARSAVTTYLNYQGKLLDSTGTPVNDGSYDMRFRVYTDLSSCNADSGANLLWTESRTGGNQVSVTNGLFSVLLGEVTAFDPAAFSGYNGSEYYLGVQIGSDAQMTPCKRIAGSMFAFNADRLDGLDSSDTGSTTAYVPVANSRGNLALTGSPSSTAGSGAVLYINPAAATSSYALIAAAVNGTTRFLVDEAGQVAIGTSTASTMLTVNGTSTVQAVLPDTTLTYSLGSESSRWLTAYVGSLHASSTVSVDGQTTLAAVSTTGNVDISGDVAITGSATGTNFTATGVASSSLLVVSNSTTFRGVEYAFPSADGAAGQFLSTNGTGQLSWSTAAGGSGGSGLFATNTESTLIRPVDTTDVLVLGNTATTTLNQLLEVNGNAQINQLLTVLNGANITGNITADSVTTTDVIAYGSSTLADATITTTLDVLGQTTLASVSTTDLSSSGQITANDLVVTGDTTLTNATGTNIEATGNLTVGNTVSTTNAIVSQDLSVGGDTTLVDVTSTNFAATGDITAGAILTGVDASITNNLTVSNIASSSLLVVSNSTTFHGVEYLFPNADGSSGQALTTNGAGALSWTTIAGGGGGGESSAFSTSTTGGDILIYPDNTTDVLVLGATATTTVNQLIEVNGNAQINQLLTVLNGASITGNLTADSVTTTDFISYGSSTLADATVTTTLDVLGHTTLATVSTTDLSSSGQLTADDIVATGDTTLVDVTSTNFAATGDITAGATLSGVDATVSNNLTVSNITSSSLLIVSNSTTFHGVEYLFPNADGTSGQALTTNGAGALSWTTISAGGGSGLFTTNTESTLIRPVDTTDVLVLGNSATTTLNQLLEVNGNAQVNQLLTVLSGASITGNLTADSVTTTDFLAYGSTTLASVVVTSTLDVQGQTTLANVSTTDLSSSGQVTANDLVVTGDTTLVDATSTNFAVSSDLAVTGNTTLINATGTNLVATGNLTAGNTVSTTDAIVSQDLSVGGDTTLVDATSSNFAATGDITAGATLTSVDATVTNDLTVSNITSSSLLVVSASTTFHGVEYLFPNADGSDGQALTTNGAGVLSWTTVGGGGGSGGGESSPFATSTTGGALVIYPENTTDVLVLGASATTTVNQLLEVAGNAQINNILTVLGDSVFVDVTSTNFAATGDITAGATLTAADATVTNTLVVNGDTTLVDATSTNFAATGDITAGATLTSVDATISNSLTVQGDTTLVDATSTNIGVTGVASSSILVVSNTTTFRGVEYLFPTADGTDGQVLSTNGSGALSWTSVSVTWSTTTVGTPGLYLSSDNDTGLGGDGSNALWLSTSNTLALYIDNTGNIGIGTSTTTDHKFTIGDGTVGFVVDSLTNLGGIAATSTIWGLDVVENYTYVVGENTTGFAIYDTSDPSSPELMSWLDLPGTGVAREVKVRGQYAYVGLVSGVEDFVVIDVSDPSNPTTTAAYNLPWYIYSFDISGNYAYFATWETGTNYGVYVYDISNPEHILRAGEAAGIGTSDLFELEVVGDTVIVGRNTGVGDEIYMYSIATNTVNPELRNAIEVGGVVNAIEVRGRYMFVGTSINTSEVIIYDISNAATSSVVATIDLTSNIAANDLEVVDDYLFVGTSATAAGLYVIDISTISSPVILFSENVGYTVQDIEVQGTTLHLGVHAGATQEYQIYQLPGIVTPGIEAGNALVDNLRVRNTVQANELETLGGLRVHGSAQVLDGLDITGGLTFATGTVATTSQTLYNVDGVLYFGGLQIATTTAGSLIWATTTLANVTFYPGADSDTGFGGDGSNNLWVTTSGSLSTYFADSGNIGLGTSTTTGHRLTVANDTIGFYVDTLSSLGGVAASGTYNGIEVVGDYAYAVGDNNAGFQIYDVSDPSNITFLSWLDLSGSGVAQEVKVRGNYAYVGLAGSTVDFEIIDISNPVNPTIVGSYNLPWYVYSFDIKGKYAYLGTFESSGSYGVYTYDITDPTGIFRVGYASMSSADVFEVEVIGDYIFAGAGSGSAEEVYIFSIATNTINPSYVDSIEMTAVVYGLEVRGRYLYVGSSASSADVSIYDISDITSSTLVSTVDLDGGGGIYASDIEIVDDLLIASTNNTNAGLQLVDITDKSNPFLIDSLDVGYTASEVEIKGTEVHIGLSVTAALEYQIYELPGLIAPGISAGNIFAENLQVGETIRSEEVIASGLEIEGSARIQDGLTIAGGVTFATTSVVTTTETLYNVDGTLYFGDFKVATTTNGALIWATTTLANVSFYPGSDSDTGFGADGSDSLWISTGGTVQAYFASNGNIAFGTTTVSAYDITIDGKSLGIVDTQISLVSQTAVTTSLQDIVVRDNYAYMVGASGSDFNVYDISDPTNPQFLNYLDLPSSGAMNVIRVQGDYAYVGGAASTDEFFIIDISSPSNPSVVSSINLAGDVNDLYIAGDTAYISTFESGLSYVVRIYDISDPGNPSPKGYVTVASSVYAYTVRVFGDYLFVGTSLNGSVDELQIYSIASSTDNPILVSSVDVAATIYDLDVRGSNLYIASSDTSNDFSVYDISDLTNPTFVSSYNTVTTPNDVIIRNDYAYLGLNTTVGEVSILDISSSTNITLEGSVDTGYSVLGMDIADGYLHTVQNINSSNEYEIFELAKITAPSARLGNLEADTLTLTEDLVTQGNALFGSGLFVKGDSYFGNGLSINGAIHLTSSTPVSTTGKLYQEAGTLYWSGASLSPPFVFNNGSVVYDGTGNVGIGTTTPEATLDVYGSIYASQSGQDLSLLISTNTLANTTVNRLLDYNGLVYVFTAANASGSEILVYDMTSSTAPRLVGEYEVGANVASGEIVADRLYVASHATGAELQILDVSEPNDITLLGTHDLISTSNDITIVGSVAYVALTNNANTMELVNIADPQNMERMLVTDVGSAASDLYVNQNKLYVANSSVLDVFDISTSTELNQVGEYTAPSVIYDIEVYNGYAYIAVASNSTGELIVLDVHSSTTPQFVGSMNQVGTTYLYDLTLAYPYVYMAGLVTSGNPPNEVQVVDVRDPYDPKYVTGYDTGVQLNAIISQGERIIVGASGNASYDELQVFQSFSVETAVAEVGNLYANNAQVGSNLQVFGRLSAQNFHFGSGAVREELVVGGLGIGTTTPGSNVYLVDANILVSPGTPTQIDTYDYGGADYPLSLHTFGNLLVSLSASTGDDVELFDVSDPENIVLISSFGLPSSPSDVQVMGDYMYVTMLAGSVEELLVYDISDWHNPTFIGGYETGVSLYDIEPKGNYLYVGSASSPEIFIFDVSDPNSISVVGRADSDAGALELEIVGNRLYAFSTSVGDDLEIYDISSTSQPVEIASLQLGSITLGDIAYHKGYVYLVGYTSSSTQEITIVDVHSTSTPSLITGIDAGTTANTVKVVGDYLFVGKSASSNAMQIYDISSSTDPLLLTQLDTPTTLTGFAVGNNNLYVSSASTGDDIEVYSLAKASIISASIGAANISQLYVERDIFADRDASIRGGLYVGGGIYTTGGIAAYGATSTFKNIYPASTTVHSLGASSTRWLSGYIDNVYIATSSVANVGNLCRDTSSGVIGVCASLREYKEDVVDLSLGLSEVLALTPREFDWIDTYGGFHDFGFVAEEVAEVNPLLAQYSNGDKGELVSVKYASMSALLVNAIQEQQAQIDALAIGSVLQGGVAFSASSSLTVKDLRVTGNLTVAKHTTFSGDSVGRAKIHTGDKDVKVTFTDVYANTPVITVSPDVTVAGGYAVTEKSPLGFTITLEQVQYYPVTFDWHAFGAEDIQVVESSDRTEESNNSAPQEVAGEQIEQEDLPEEENTPTSTEEISETETPSSTPPTAPENPEEESIEEESPTSTDQNTGEENALPIVEPEELPEEPLDEEVPAEEIPQEDESQDEDNSEDST